MKAEEKFQRYLQLRYSPSTVKIYLWAFRSAHERLRTQEDMEDYLIEKYVSRSQNPFYIGFVKAVIDCFKLPFQIPKMRRRKNNKEKIYKFLTVKQVRFIIEHTSPWVSMLTQLYFETGLRLRELMNAEWNKVNPQERTIQGIGKGNKPFKVKMSKACALRLWKYLQHNERQYPFRSDESDKDHAKSFWYHLRRECEDLGIPGIHPHRLRHALAHFLRADKRFDLEEIRTKLRHNDISTTSIYAKATQEEVDEKIDKEVFQE